MAWNLFSDWEPIKASFPSPWSIDKSVEKLNALLIIQHVVPSIYEPTLRRGMVGSVSQDDVELEWTSLFDFAPFKPRFKGKFISKDEGCILEGKFEFTLKAFVLIAILIFCIALTVLIGNNFQDLLKALLILGVPFSLFGFLMYGAHVITRTHTVFISRKIESAFKN